MFTQACLPVAVKVRERRPVLRVGGSVGDWTRCLFCSSLCRRRSSSRGRVAEEAAPRLGSVGVRGAPCLMGVVVRARRAVVVAARLQQEGYELLETHDGTGAIVIVDYVVNNVSQRRRRSGAGHEAGRTRHRARRERSFAAERSPGWTHHHARVTRGARAELGSGWAAALMKKTVRVACWVSPPFLRARRTCRRAASTRRARTTRSSLCRSRASTTPTTASPPTLPRLSRCRCVRLLGRAPLGGARLRGEQSAWPSQ